MMQVYQIREKKRAADTGSYHVDGSGRLQTVYQHTNPRYHHLIEAFRELTVCRWCSHIVHEKNLWCVEPRRLAECFN